jgi:hypothetical protein
MTIEQLIEMARRRIAYLSTLRTAADRIGDAAEVARVDAELEECEATLSRLQAA